MGIKALHETSAKEEFGGVIGDLRASGEFGRSL